MTDTCDNCFAKARGWKLLYCKDGKVCHLYIDHTKFKDRRAAAVAWLINADSYNIYREFEHVRRRRDIRKKKDG